MEQIGLLFDIDKLDGPTYGQDAFRILFKETPHRYLTGCALYCGDLDIVLPGGLRPYCFCINIANLANSQYFEELWNALVRIDHPSLPSGDERFWYGQHSLVPVATVSSDGVIPTEHGQWLANATKELG